MNLKLTIEGTIYKVLPIKENKTGYNQTVILHVEGGEFRGKKYPEEFFVISTDFIYNHKLNLAEWL